MKSGEIGKFSYTKKHNNSEWNIEPSRTASNYAAVIAAKCNP